MNSKHRRTLERIFERPTVADLRWQDWIGLAKALGGIESKKRAGSRVMVAVPERQTGALGIVVLHKPHPKPEIRKHDVEKIRRFLDELGYRPGFDGE